MKTDAGNLTSVIIPAYNEERVIDGTLARLTAALKGELEIIVVINGCRDNTLGKVREFARKDGRIRFLEFKRALGKGGAVLEGFKFSKGKYVGFIDADGAFEIEGIVRMMNKLHNGAADCVIASKWKGKSTSDIYQTFTRRLMSRGLNLIVRKVLGLNFDDTQGGAKFMKRDVLDAIGSDFICRGFDFDIELLYRMQNKKFRVIEEFIPTTCPEKSSVRMKDILSILSNIYRLKNENPATDL